MNFLSPINQNPNYFKTPNPCGLGEAYIRHIYREVHNKKFSHLMTITGRHRTGKSLAAIILGCLLDKTFYENMEKRTVYTAVEFSMAIQKMSEENVRGGVIVWDEANLGLSSRNWYTEANKHINFTVQAFGFLLPIVIFVTQDVTFLDSQPRKMFHTFMEVDRNNNEYSNIRPFLISISKRSGKIFYSYPRMRSNQDTTAERSVGTIIKMKPLRFMKPPKKMIARYEAHSIKRKKELMKENDVIIQGITQKEKDKPEKDFLSDEEIVDHCIAKRNDPVFVNNKGRFWEATIKNKFDVTVQKARYITIVANARLRKLKEDEIVD